MENNNTVSIMKSLESQYLQHKYSEGIDLLIKNKDYFSRDMFHYNLSSLYAKSGDYALGRYHIEKSMHYGNIGPKALNNLDFMREKLAVKDASSSNLFYEQVIGNLTCYPDLLFTSISLFFILCAFVLFLKHKIIRVVPFLMLILLACAPIVIKKTVDHYFISGILLKDSFLKAGPSEIFPDAGNVKAGSKIIFTKIDNGWFKIIFPGNLDGWIKGENIGIL